jgi:biopolymer transport protein ExbD
VTVQGEAVARIEDILASGAQNIEPIGRRLAEVNQNVIGLTTKAVAESREVTILADRSVPFSVVKKIMSTCTSQGFGRISLAVLQKAPETLLSQS